MARTNVVLITGALLGAFGAGLLLGRSIDRGETALFDSAGNSLVAPEVRRSQDTPTHPFQQVRDEDAARPGTTADVEGDDANGGADFGYRRLTLNTNGDEPRACLQFNAPLDTSGETNYEDYIRLTPQTKPAISVDGVSLCMTGLEFNAEYRVQLRAGLVNAEGDRLSRSQEVTVAFGDKPAYVGFAGNGVVLPRLEADGLGLETVNVSQLKVRVFRVSNRSLARKSILAGKATGEDEYGYVFEQENGEDVGVKVFDDVIDVASAPNDLVSTVFPLGAALPDLTPGAYFIRLEDVSPGAPDNRAAQAWRWVMFTDLALSTYSSSEGVDLIARSISTARPRAGVELHLIAQNNDILARTVTGADGAARFEKAAISGDAPLTPKMIMAYGPQDDFAVLDLTRAPLDLSERNIGGRAATPVVDGYVYFDRGIYRPGESVHITGLLRSADGRAVDRPSTVIITRPNGVEAHRERISEYDIGGYSFRYDVPSSAPRGLWTVRVDADGVGQTAVETFAVEDFVPQRLEVAIEMDETTPMRADERREVGVKSRYLYGAPAADLQVEGEARLRLDPNPFPDFKGYRYGPADARFTERFLPIENGKTDGAGETTLTLDVADTPGHPAPLRADLVVGVVEPGGRVVRESARIPVRPLERYVGLRLAGGKRSVGQGASTQIEAVILNRLGGAEAGTLEWRLVEEEYWFDWYRQNNAWRWRRSFRDILVAEGRLETDAGGPGLLTQQLDAGSYRLTAIDPQTKKSTDLRFYVGWRSYESGADTPDQATLSVLSDQVTPGARARLFLDPPYAGEAVITVATDKVHLVQRLKVDQSGREIIIDTDPAWGPDFYVMATIVTPRSPSERPVPRRAMAVAHVGFDMSPRTLNIALGAPDLVRPRQDIDIPIQITGTDRREEVMVTLAAVDEGILRLTKFASPDPVAHYFGKRRLGIEVRDDYGRMLDANLGAAQRFGGDQIGGEGLTVVPTKTVALFNGPVTLDDNGAAVITASIPDFNGELRLMAVAWSADKLGAASQPLTVRDPVPALLSLPRFLAPGDTAEARLLVDNVDGVAGPFQVDLKGQGPVEAAVSREIELAKGEQAQEGLEVKSGRVGVGSMTLSVAGADGFRVAHDYPIQVRTPYFPVTQISTSRLSPGESVELNRTLIEPFIDGSTHVAVSFSPLRGVDPGPLLDALYRYPYGCTEQLTSSAMPLLFVDALGAAAGRGPEYEVRPRVQRAVNKLLDRQSPDGAFGLWRVGDNASTGWLGAYVTDFLFRAKEEGYAVPQAALDKAYAALEKVSRRLNRWTYVSYRQNVQEGAWTTDTNDRLIRRSAAYAFYVLARAGQADLSDLRYMHDSFIDKIDSPLARAHIGAALILMGDRARGLNAFEKAREALGYDNDGDYYQTKLRDAAGVLALLSEVQGAPGVDEVSDAFDQFMKEPQRLHTQEKAFVLLAAQAMLRASGPVSLSRNGRDMDGLSPTPRFFAASDELADGLSFQNTGEGPIFANVSVYGSPSAAPAPEEQGFSLEKRLLTRTGEAVDLSGIKQNDRLIVVVSGEPTGERLHPLVIADLLPAGFEIEAILTPEDAARGNGQTDGPYGWLGKLSRMKTAEARDDRFVAALDIRSSRFTAAYLVRAVTPGEFAFPGAVVEDMYRPGVFARTQSGRLTIAPAE